MFPIWYFFPLLANQTFWVAIGAVGTITVAYLALYPILDSRRINEAVYKQAIQLHVTPSGILTLENIFNEPIIIKVIAQSLLKEPYHKPPQNLSKLFENGSKFVSNPKYQYLILNKDKVLAPKMPLVISDSSTNIKDPTESAWFWVVGTRIIYTKVNDKDRTTVSFIHRFSSTLDPTGRWVEIL